MNCSELLRRRPYRRRNQGRYGGNTLKDQQRVDNKGEIPNHRYLSEEEARAEEVLVQCMDGDNTE